jgi:hypothetical protein
VNDRTGKDLPLHDIADRVLSNVLKAHILAKQSAAAVARAHWIVAKCRFDQKQRHAGQARAVRRKLKPRARRSYLTLVRPVRAADVGPYRRARRRLISSYRPSRPATS